MNVDLLFLAGLSQRSSAASKDPRHQSFRCRACIYSRYLNHKYEIEVTGADGSTATFHYSALSWSNDIIARNVEAAVPTAKALYLYHYAAVDYLGK